MVKQYINYGLEILTDKNSVYKPNRTGVDTISKFGGRIEYDLSEGFPLLTTKKMFTKSILHELIWFLRGDTNIKYLVDNNVHIWTDNAFQRYLRKTGKDNLLETYSEDWYTERKEYIDKIKSDEGFAHDNGDLGPVYGAQWRKWKTLDGKEVDQVTDVVNTLKNRPDSRRIIINAWNAGDLAEMELPPCHVMYQFNVRDQKLDCQMYQRSADYFLGVPFNIASTAALTHVMANQADLEVGKLSHVIGDSHFYCGKGDRGEFYGNNLDELKSRIHKETENNNYSDVLEWINENAPSEGVEDDKYSLDHITAFLEQAGRKPKNFSEIEVAKKKFDELEINDFKLLNYESHPSIRRAMAV